MQKTFDIYIPDDQPQAAIDIEQFVNRWGGIVLGIGYSLNYFNIWGYANRDLLPTLIKKSKESGWYINEYPPEIQDDIDSEDD
jgi:hypothetical protein